MVILTGAGQKAFVAGADINELAVQNPVSGKEYGLAGQRIFDSMLETKDKKHDEIFQDMAAIGSLLHIDTPH